MPQARTNVEVKNFQNGLRTELNPLDSSLSTCSVLENWDIEKDGSIQPRGKLLSKFESTSQYSSLLDGTSYYEWQVSSGDVLKVVGSRSSLAIYRNEVVGNPVYTFGGNFSEAEYAHIGDDLVITNSDEIGGTSTGSILTLSYQRSSGSISNRGYSSLTINDVFGIDDGLGLIEGPPHLYFVTTSNAAELTTTARHSYNLLNQGFLPKHLHQYKEASGTSPFPVPYLGAFPTNSYIFSIGFNSNNDFSRGLLNKVMEERGFSEAPKGKGLIKLMQRGGSRRSFAMSLGVLSSTVWDPFDLTSTDQQIISYREGDYPLDTSTGGKTFVESFQGRMFYSFSGWSLSSGDSRSPNVNNLICFSRSLTNISRANECHQQNDPTSGTASDIIDSDGGFIEIPEIGNVIQMESLESSLLVFSDNGVWEIAPSDGVFTATGYVVRKITTVSPSNKDSIVLFNNSCCYVSDDNVELIMPDERSGRLYSQDISKLVIDSYLKNLLVLNQIVSSVYEPTNRKVFWLFEKRFGVGYEVLIFDTVLNAYSTYKIDTTELSSTGALSQPTFLRHLTLIDSTRAGSFTGDYRELIGFLTTSRQSTSKYYECLLDTSDQSVQATLITNDDTFGDGTKKKNSQWVTVFMEQTEDGQSSTEILNPSSCLVQARWDFADHESSNKFSQEFEAYRLRRTPGSDNTSFIYGHSVISTRNKIRGRGRALSLQFKNTPGKRCHLYGYNLDISGNTIT